MAGESVSAGRRHDRGAGQAAGQAATGEEVATKLAIQGRDRGVPAASPQGGLKFVTVETCQVSPPYSAVVNVLLAIAMLLTAMIGIDFGVKGFQTGSLPWSGTRTIEGVAAKVVSIGSLIVGVVAVLMAFLFAFAMLAQVVGISHL